MKVTVELCFNVSIMIVLIATCMLFLQKHPCISAAFLLALLIIFIHFTRVSLIKQLSVNGTDMNLGLFFFLYPDPIWISTLNCSFDNSCVHKSCDFLDWFIFLSQILKSMLAMGKIQFHTHLTTLPFSNPCSGTTSDRTNWASIYITPQLQTGWIGKSTIIVFKSSGQKLDNYK